MSSPLKKLRKKHTDSDEWAVSFADMMTLLLCFFVLMLSISVVDIERYDSVADSLTSALAPSLLPASKPVDAPVAEIKKRTQPPSPAPQFPQEPQQSRQQTAPAQQVPATERQGENLEQSLRTVATELEDRLRHAGSAVRLVARDEGIAIQLHGPVFFELGKATLTAEADLFLRTIADELAPTKYRLSIEGHTDDLPIRTAQFPSNWELSSARAAAVARYLIAGGVLPTRLDVRGYAHTHPIVPNKENNGTPLPANRVLNRRVVILVKPAPSAVQ